MNLTPDDPPWDTLVLGLGNVLWADEGFGVRAVERFNERFVLPANVRIMDGGTQGLFLLPWVRTAHSLLIFDAIDFGLPPGSLKIVLNDEVPRFMGVRKMSMHQTGFQEVLATADLSGSCPSRLALVGVQPDTLDDYGGSLRPAIRSRIDAAIDTGIELLEGWGIKALPRERLALEDAIGPAAIGIDLYESGRPG